MHRDSAMFGAASALFAVTLSGGYVPLGVSIVALILAASNVAWTIFRPKPKPRHGGNTVFVDCHVVDRDAGTRP